MFKTLREIFRKEDLLQQAFHASVEMLQIDLDMFRASRQSLQKSDNGEMSVDVYALDKKINEYQRDIRRKVLAHMIASSSKDIVFGLILVSIVIDIERIGDYIKNIVDLARAHPEKLEAGEVEEKLTKLGRKVSDRFKLLIEAFENSDVDKARQVMSKHRSITKQCDTVLNAFLSEDHPEMSTRDAVAVVLYTRYMKRISSHISNIASGIVNPFDRIGFSE
jgi:phosphate uptake regulator